MKISNFLRKLFVILFWIGIWGAAAYFIGKPLLLPSPTEVMLRLFNLLALSDFWMVTALSLSRITVGIVSAIILGIFLALITHYSGFLHDLLSPIQTITKVTPVASFILLVLIWLNRNVVPAVIAGIMVIPVIWTNVAAGLDNIDNNLMEMANIYKISRKTRLKRILLPSIMPYFLSAVQTSIGIGWKAGIAAEVLTVPAKSIGKMIADSKLYMETIDLFTWTIVVIFISLMIEKLVIAWIRRFGSKYFHKVDSYD